MANEQWRLDLKADIRRACAAADGFDIARLEPDDYQEHATRVLAAVLPHFELAYKRGEQAAKMRGGSRIVQENERLRRELEQVKKGLT